MFLTFIDMIVVVLIAAILINAVSPIWVEIDDWKEFIEELVLGAEEVSFSDVLKGVLSTIIALLAFYHFGLLITLVVSILAAVVVYGLIAYAWIRI